MIPYLEHACGAWHVSGGLYTIIERVFEPISFDAPDRADKSVVITADYVRERLADVLKSEDLSRFIL